MEYLLDTVTIIRHFTDIGKTGKKAKKILEAISNNKFMISVISLMEILYLSEKNRINLSLKYTISKINSSINYTILDLTPEILEVAETIEFKELHDRLILATAKWLNIPVISSDKQFERVDDIEVIWD